VCSTRGKTWRQKPLDAAWVGYKIWKCTQTIRYYDQHILCIYILIFLNILNSPQFFTTLNLPQLAWHLCGVCDYPQCSCRALDQQSKALRFESQSRQLDFSSYMYRVEKPLILV
jgi:hypothetical protein